MNGEYQDRVDIDKIYTDVYDVTGKTLNIPVFKDNTVFTDDKGEKLTLDEILTQYVDKSEINQLLEGNNTTDALVIAMGLGVFKIVDGDLIYECGVDAECPFYIENGELCVDWTSEVFRVQNGECIYQEEVT